MLRRTVLTTVVALAGLAFTTGCSGDDPLPTGQQVPDFSLPDVNPTSSTFGNDVSPRDFISQGSAWYFGHST